MTSSGKEDQEITNDGPIDRQTASPYDNISATKVPNDLVPKIDLSQNESVTPVIYSREKIKETFPNPQDFVNAIFDGIQGTEKENFLDTLMSDHPGVQKMLSKKMNEKKIVNAEIQSIETLIHEIGMKNAIKFVLKNGAEVLIDGDNVKYTKNGIEIKNGAEVLIDGDNVKYTKNGIEIKNKVEAKDWTKEANK